MNRRRILQSATAAITLAAAGCASGPSAGRAASDTASETLTDDPTPTEPLPPGISDGRVIDSHALSTTHDKKLKNTSFTLETVSIRTVPEPSGPTTDRQSLTVTLAPDHDRFVGQFERGDESWNPAVVRPNFPTNTDIYSDGETVWFNGDGSENGSRRSRPLEQRQFDFTRLGAIQTTLNKAKVSGKTHHDSGTALTLVKRFDSSELPEGGPEAISHRARIRPDGQFQFVESTYRRSDPRRFVRLRHTFLAVGETAVERPEWVEGATDGGDGNN